MVVFDSDLLLETGDYILLEDGFHIVLESGQIELPPPVVISGSFATRKYTEKKEEPLVMQQPNKLLNKADNITDSLGKTMERI